MLNKTTQALNAFDNQHDFERLAADILNKEGYKDVEPMAPGGGSDGGQDIKFKDGEEQGFAFVTLRKDIKTKFNEDLAKLKSDAGLIALFCKLNVTPVMKREFTKSSLEKSYRIQFYDLERLRSLLDSNMKDLRRKYLQIDDENSLKLRSEAQKLLRFPNAVPDEISPPTILETLLTDQLPRRLFDLLMKYSEEDIREVPLIGNLLHSHLLRYNEFRNNVINIETDMLSKINILGGGLFIQSWKIHLQYIFIRLGGTTKNDIMKGHHFLNYGITWDSAEILYNKIIEEPDIIFKFSELLNMINDIGEKMSLLT